MYGITVFTDLATLIYPPFVPARVSIVTVRVIAAAPSMILAGNFRLSVQRVAFCRKGAVVAIIVSCNCHSLSPRRRSAGAREALEDSQRAAADS